MNDTILQINDFKLTHKITKQVLVSIESLSIKKGECIFINGNNGTGKSTLLNWIFKANSRPNYVDCNTQDSVIYGQNSTIDRFASEELFNSRIVYLSQKSEFPSNLSLFKTLWFSSKISIDNSSLNKKEKKILIDKAKELASYYLYNGIEENTNLFSELFCDSIYYTLETIEQKTEYAKKKLKRLNSDKLSGGQTKLVAFLSALIKVHVFESSIFVMDEPFNNMDFNKISKINEMISQLVDERRENPISLIIVSHLMLFSFIKKNYSIQYEIENITRKLVVCSRLIDHTSILKDF